MLLSGLAATAALAAPRFNVTFPESQSREALSGRLLLIVSPAVDGEPMSQVIWDDDAIPFFGVDVENWKPGKRQVIDAKTSGFPVRSLEELPEGNYRVQAVLNRYERFKLEDGRMLLLPPDKGEGQAWNRKPGNLFSKAESVRIEPRGRSRINLVLDQAIPPIASLNSGNPSTHATCESAASGCPSSGVAMFSLRPGCACPGDSTSIRRPAIRS